MQSRVTIVDVAREAGVSVATVSKVLNGKDGVAGATAVRVQGVIETLGYESSIVARSLRSSRTNVVGILVPEFEPFSAEVLKGVARGIGETQYELLAYAGAGARLHEGWERRSLSRLSGTLIDGAVLVTPTVTEVATTIPVVAIDPHTGTSRLPSVVSDNDDGGYQAARHLLDLGHTRIAFISGRPDLESSRGREAGYRRAMTEAGLAVDPALVVAGDYQREGARRATAALLDLAEPPTAVFAANDLSALATIEEATQRGVDVPGGLSVVGFDDVPEAARSVPGLTTVRQQMSEMGAVAAAMLLDLLRRSEPVNPHVRLGTELVVRASTAVPRR
ncbi:LacI family transcriptional regulator [Miniimonas arenae]|uniref:LacI family transcriptional regulator n=1 Tax=Miniimonas arenae TaxID=676201 RepID=A0A5C5BDF1_9MICO|nr:MULTISPECIES: LacI family DNA-binding transcriptional regulator [Miniimonas]TNU74049.1 LacI family transcriptional regulator [Miniimonas arenae]